MDVKIRDELMEIEGHLKWIETILSGKFTNSKEQIAYITDLLKRESEYNEDWEISECSQSTSKDNESPKWNLEQDYNKESPKYASLFAIHLNKSAMRVYTGSLDEALKTLEQLRSMLPKLTGEHKRLKKAVDYSLEILEWTILQTKKPITGDQAVKIQEFREKWELLQNEKKSRAVICYLRGSLERELLLYDDESKLKLFEQVIEMDPDYHIWYHFAYLKIRSLRYESSGGFQPASEREVMLCKKGIELAPNIALSLYDEAILLKDMIRVSRNSEERTLHEIGSSSPEKCLELLEKALLKAKTLGMKKFMLKIKYQMVDVMMMYGRDEEENIRGLDVLLECLEEYPTAPLVHQKLGQFYHYGNPDYLRDYEKARYHFKAGLELNKYKYINCLREYIKLFRNLPPPLPVEEAIDLLNKCLANCTLSWQRKKQMAQIRIWRANILWVYHQRDYEMKERACEDWLFVIKNHPDDKGWMMNTIWKSPFPVYIHGRFPGRICKVELTEVLEGMKCKMGKGSEDAEVIDAFLKEIQSCLESCCGRRHTAGGSFDWRANPNHCDDERTNVSERYLANHETSSNSVNNWRGSTTKPRTTSEADDDLNWRRRK